MREAVELDVTDVIVEHIGRIDAVQRYLVAGDFKVEELGVVAAFDAHGDFGAFLATKMFLHIFVVDFFTKGFLSVNLDDLVAGHDADLFRRASCCGADDGDGVADKLVGYANAIKAAHKGLVGFFHIFFGNIG